MATVQSKSSSRFIVSQVSNRIWSANQINKGSEERNERTEMIRIQEAALTGKMKDKAPPGVNITLIKWVRNDAPEAEWKTVGPLLEQNCGKCHDAESGLPEVTKLDVAKSLAAVDHGASIGSLTRVSHIHLFGISFIFLFVGLIFAMAEFDQFWKIILITTPFAFLVLDVASWWLTKFWPGFAWFTMIGGLGYSLAALVMFGVSFAQMWLPRWTQK